MPTDRGDASDIELLAAFEPVVRFTEGEMFFPVSVEDYVAQCELLQRAPGQEPTVVLARGEVTLERLAAVGTHHPEPGQFLRLVDEPLGRVDQHRWRRRADRPRFRRTGRLARVGVLSRVVDALLRLSLVFRGSVASGTEAAAETTYRQHMQGTHHPYYGRVCREGGYIALQYWYFYAFNDWRSRAYGVNDHEADWEQVVVYLAEQPDGTHRPAWVAFSSHDEAGDELRRRWDDPDLTLVGDHPVVHAGLGSHSGAYLAGEYLTTFEAPAFHGLIRFARGIGQIFLPWTRGQQQSGIGIPYVDYARGDGLSIGPGQDRPWRAVVIDDRTPWVFEYRGLWGNDTKDPVGGERGPAGPRYERNGTVRRSWGDILGWSGLSKVPPNHEVAERLVEERLGQLRAERETLAVDIDELRAKLQADVASGVADTSAGEHTLADRVARQVTLDDEGRRLTGRLADPEPRPGPHDHLTHRRLPEATTPPRRARVLAVWSAMSTPLIIALIGLAFLPRASVPLVASAFGGVLLVLGIEALARRNLFRFVVTLIALAVVFVIGTTLAGLTVFFGWQVTVAVCLFALAAGLLINNLREIVRD